MISITEMTIAARLSGMDYGKFVHLLRQGLVTLPSMAEIRKRMVTIKTAEPQAARPNTPVIQYSKAGEYIARYDTVKSAAMALDVDNSCINNALGSIYRACDGRQKTAYDYQWRYEGDEPPGIISKARHQQPITVAERLEMTCPICGQVFRGTKRKRYCSPECAHEADRQWRLKYYKGWRQKRRETKALDRR